MKVLLKLIALASLIFKGAFIPIPVASEKMLPVDTITEYSYPLDVDGVQFQLVLPMKVKPFTISGPEEMLQMATSFEPSDYLEVSVSVIPQEAPELLEREFGPLVRVDKNFNEVLRELRAEQGDVQLPGLAMTAFGEPVRGIAHRVVLPPQLGTNLAVIVNESVATFAERVWLLRISVSEPNYDSIGHLLTQVRIEVENANTPSLSLALLNTVRQVPNNLQAIESTHTSVDLPTPSWWDGECDVLNFSKSYPLGGQYRGMKACGPINTYHIVSFGVGVAQYEWQCPELSKRYLYLAFGTPPYSADGKNVVWYYPRTDLEKIANGTPNKGPNAGDVLSYGPTTLYGHTSVVSASNIAANGTGTITVIEQNSSLTGTRTHNVVNWVVQASMAVSGWLHIPTIPDELYYFPLFFK